MDNFERLELIEAYKKANQVANTNPNLAPYEEVSLSESHVKIQNVWMDASYIPNVAPDASLDGNGFYSVQAFNETIPVVRKLVDLEITPLDGTRATYYSPLLIDAIPDGFGSGYYATLRDTAGNDVPFGLNKWVIDGNSGTLSFLDGIPAGYAKTFKVTFWRYCGRRGPDRVLFNDGTTKMVSGYVPQYAKSVADKDYVDKNVAALESKIKVVTPTVPPSIDGMTLTPTIPGEISAQYLLDGETWDAAFTGSTVSLDVPTFYNPETGILSLMVNDVAIDSIDLTSDVKAGTVMGSLGSFVIEKAGYLDEVQVYKKIKMRALVRHETLPFQVSDKSRLSVRLRHVIDQVYTYSDTAHFGFEDSDVLSASTYGVISVVRIRDLSSANKSISGVPALTLGDSLTVDSKAYVYCNFSRKDLPYAKETYATLGESYQEFPAASYATLQPTSTRARLVSVPAGRYGETFDFSMACVKLDGSGERPWSSFSYPIRVDSVSDETIRVKSGIGKFPTAFGDVYDSAANLALNEELQLVNGKFRYPSGNYTGNGKFVDQSISGVAQAAGPNYDLLSPDTVRWVTFKFALPVCNGAYVEFLDPVGMADDPETHVLTNAQIFVKVKNGTPWLDLNGCFDGVTQPKADGDPCLVVWDSSAARKRLTFGKKAVGGDFYVRVGFKKSAGISFSRVTVEPQS